MTDLVERLRAALDRTKQKARAATEGPWKVDNEAYAEAIYAADGTAVVAGGRWGGEASVFESTEDALHIASWDPNNVLRLIERDRALVMEYEALKSLIEEENRGREDGIVSWLANTGDTRDGWLRAGRLLALQHGVERAADFWLRDT
jgi:hypothetical protein